MTGTEFARHAAADGSESMFARAPGSATAAPSAEPRHGASRAEPGASPSNGHDAKHAAPGRAAPRLSSAQRSPVDAAVARATAKSGGHPSRAAPHAARAAPAAAEPIGEWQIWIETPAPAASSGGSVYYYRAADRLTQWERPEGPNVLVMTREEAAKHAEARLGRASA